MNQILDIDNSFIFFLSPFLPEDIWYVILCKLPFSVSKDFIFISKFLSKLFYKSVTSIEKTYIKNLKFADEIKKYTNLTKLDLYNNDKITDDVICKLINITKINLSSNSIITDHGISKLTKITHINLCRNTKITDDCLVKLINIKNINLSKNRNVTDNCLRLLTNLVHINLSVNFKIADYGIKDLTNLKTLVFSGPNITDSSFTNLINLTAVRIGGNNITNDGLRKLIPYNNLTSLSLDLGRISNYGIKDFYSLTKLDVKTNNNIDYDGIKNLTNLTELGKNRLISNKCINNLKLLTNIY